MALFPVSLAVFLAALKYFMWLRSVLSLKSAKIQYI